MTPKMCPNPNCHETNPIQENYCPECGTEVRKLGFRETVKLIGLKKDIKNGKKAVLTPLEAERYIQGETREEKLERKRDENRLFTENMESNEIMEKIYSDMDHLALHEAGTGWMKAGAILSMNPTNQIIASGLKSIIDQNKILIRQNELIIRKLGELQK